MAQNPGKKPSPKAESVSGGEEIAAVTSEDLSLDSEREALKKAREGDVQDAGGGEGHAGYGNLHFGDQKRGDWKDSTGHRDGADIDPVPGGADDRGAARARQNDKGQSSDSRAGNETLTSEESAAEDANTGREASEASPDRRPQDAQTTDATPPASRSAKAAATAGGEGANQTTGAEPTGETTDDDRTPVNEAPTDIDLSNDIVAENDAGASVAFLSSTDPDANDTAVYSLVEDSSGLFEIVGNELRLKDGAVLDHEEQDSYELLIQVEDSAGNIYSETVTIHVADLNEGPTDIQISNDSVAENSAGATVATLSSSDPDSNDSASYSIAQDDSGLFEIVGNELKLKEGATLDHEAQDSYEITLQVEDSAGATHTQIFTINVGDVNEGPVELALMGQTIDENETGAVVGTLSAFDPDVSDTLNYTVSDNRFEVVGNQLKAKDGVSFDHETLDAIDVTVTATDQSGLATSQSFTIDITDLNEGPTDLALSNNIVDENQEGVLVATLSSTDPDENDTASYMIVDDESGLFEVVGNELRLRDGVALNHEAQDSYELTLLVEDSGGAAHTATVTINVADLNEGPADIALSADSVNENDAGATVATLSSSDPDAGDSATYSIADDASGLFEIVGDELKLKDGVTLDHESQDSYEVTLKVEDSAGASYSETVTINVADLNEGPTDIALSADSVNENDAGATVATLSSSDPDAGDSATYTIVGDASGLFEIVGDELKLKDGVRLDHESQDSYEVTLQVEDSAGATYTESVTINVADLNEGPTDIQLSNTSVDENSAGAVVGTLSAVDPDAGDSVTFEVSDNRFEIVGNQLKVKDGVSFDHETTDSIDVTVTATDAGGLETTQSFAIDIEDINEGPTDISISGDTVAENSPGALIATLSAADPDSGDTATFSIAQDDSGLFEVVGNELKLKDAAALDHEGQDSYDITMQVVDSSGATYTESVTINVADINEGPTDLQLSNSNVNEGEAGANVGVLTAFDPDAGDSLTFTVSDERFEVVGNELKLKDGVELDFNETESIDVTVTATDMSGVSTTEAFSIGVNDTNEGPELGLATGPGLQASYYDIGHSLSDLDQVDFDATPDATGVVDSLNYMQGQQEFWDGAPNDYFAAKYEGQLVVDEGGSYTFHMASDDGSMLYIDGEPVLDNDGLHGTRTRSVTVDLDEGPHDVEIRYFENGGSQTLQLAWSGPDTGGVSEVIGGDAFQHGFTSDTLSVPEDESGAVVAHLTVSDPDAGDTHTFSVDDDRFEVVEDNGEYVLKLKDGVSLDHEAESSVDVSVTVTDSAGASDTEHYTVAVDDVNSAPEIAVVGGEGLHASYYNIGHSLSDLDQVDFNAVPDAEATVDSINYMQGQDEFWDGAPSDYFAAKYEGQIVVDEGGTYTLYLASDDGSMLFIDGVPVIDNDGLHATSTQSVTLDLDAGPHDVEIRYFENGGSQTLQLAWSGPDTGGVQEVIGGDSYRLPEFTDEDRLGLTENVSGETAAILAITDADGDAVTYEVSDDRFELVETENGVALKLKDGVSVDHETESEINVTVTATDEHGESTSSDLSIPVADVAESPTDISLSTDSVNENDAGAVVATLSATDPDAGDTSSFALTDDASSLFEVVGNELKLKDGASLDYETQDSHSLTIEVTDSTGNTYSETVTISVADVNEAPVDISFTPELPSEVLTAGVSNAEITTANGGGAETASFDLSGASAGSAEITIDFAHVDNSLELVVNGQSLADGVIQLERAHYDPATESFLQFADGSEISQPWVPNADGSPRIQVIITEEGVTVYATRTPTSGVMEPLELINGEFITPDFVEGENSVQIINPDGGGPDGLEALVSATYTSDSYTANENADGAVVGTLSSSDPDAGDSATFTIADDASGLFEISGSELKLKSGASLDYEAQDSHDVTVEVTDSAGNTYSEVITINVADANEAPVDFVLEPEAASGTLSLNQDGGNDDVAIAANMEGFPTQALTVEVTFTSSQTDVGSGVPLFSYAASGGSNNEALIWLESGTGNVHIYLAGSAINTGIPNSSLLDGVEHQVSFTWDQASNELKVFIDGDEEFATSIDIRDLRADGTVAFGQEQDSEGGSFDTNQVFEGEISEARIFDYARSGEEIAGNAGKPLSGPEAQTGLVSNWVMNNADDGVVRDIAGNNDLQLANGADIKAGAAYDTPTVVENETGAVVGTLSATDGDTGEAVSNFSIVDDTSGLFEVVGNELKVKDGISLDHEAQESYEVTVQATGAGGESTQQTVTINVADVNEAPIDVSFDPASMNGVLSLNQDGGNDDYAVASNLEGFPTDALTVEVTFTSSQADVGDGVPLFSYAASTGSDNEALLWLEGGSGNMHVFLAGQKINTGIPNSSLLDGEEHQVSFTWDQSTNELKVFIDGDEAFATSIDIRDLKSDGTLVLGQEQDGEGGRFDTGQVFEGEISEVRIFDYARSDEEIADNAGKPFDDPETEPGLVNNWVMDAENGGVIEDLVGVNHMQLQGGASIVDSEYGGVPTVAENDAGAVVGTISATDPGTGAAVTNFSITDDASGMFEMIGDQLKLKDGAALDYEAQDSYEITVAAIGAGGEETLHTVTVNVSDIDEFNIIVGTDGNDRLRGTENNDVIAGGDGNDNIRGDAGADELSGGAGNDLIYADAEDTVIDGGEGTDRVIVQGDGDFSIDMTASSVERVDGAAGNDFMDATGMTERVTQIGNDGDDTLIGGEANDIQRGGDGDDVIAGGDGNDNIRGDAGADELSGGAGNDLIYADAEDTVIDGGEGTDRVIVQGDGDFSIDMTASSVERVDGAAGNDFMDATGMTERVTQIGNDGDDTLIGGEANDIQRGGDGDDVIAGGDGNDNIRGDAGADELSGGAGNDLIYADAEDTVDHGGEGTDRVIVQGDGDFSIDMTASSVERVDGAAGNDFMDATGMTERVTQIGNDGDDTLIGGEANDIQRGGDGDDVIAGGDGNDNIRGDAGADELSGGAGNDLIYADAEDTVIDGGVGTDRVIVQGDGDFSIDMTASSVERVDGAAGNDFMDATGMTERVTQIGNDGDDTLIGGEANDIQRGGDGDDVIAGGDGNDNIRGDAGADELSGGAGNDLIYADAEDTVIDGGEGTDRVIVQGDGDFSIDMTASSVERVDGAAGNDFMDATGMTERVTQIGNGGDDTLIGGEANDIQRGGDGDDVIAGGDGNDNIRGDAGADELSGGAGNDQLHGGDGNDVFVYEMGDGSDRVYGGGGGWTDTIQLADGETPLGDFGVDWTIELTEGSIISSDEEGIIFSEDSDGIITLSDGSTINFTDIDEVVI